MTEVFHHGARVLEQDIGYRPIETTDTSNIGVLYTAPNADPILYPLNKPVLFLGDRNQVAALGSAGTGKDLFDGIYDQGVAPAIIGVRVEEGATAEETIMNMVGDYGTRSGVHAFWGAKQTLRKKPKILIATGYTHQRVTGGITQIPVAQGGAGYTEAGTTITINGNGFGGGAKAKPIIVAGVITGVAILNCGLGYKPPGDPGAVTIAIVGDGTNAALGPPQIGTAANPVVAEMLAVANRLRATVIADCPNGVAEQSVAYRGDFNTRRLYCVDNWPLVAWSSMVNIAQPSSARIAGILAATDNDEGFWVSPSNKVVQGIVGTSRPIDDNGVGGESDYLNQNDVATIVHRTTGYKLWGNHAATSDTLWKMFAAGRCVDTVYESIETACDEVYPGRPENIQFFEGVVESVNEKLRYYKSIGAILGGKIWLDPALNPPGQLILGKPKFSGDIEPVGVAEDIQFVFHREPGYWVDLMNQAVLNLSR